MGGAESLSLVGENNIFKGTADGFDDLPGQGADNHNMLLDAELIIDFNGAIDSSLPVNRETDLVPRGGTHSSSLAGCQNDRVTRSACAHVNIPSFSCFRTFARS